jgi:hypothetical protein
MNKQVKLIKWILFIPSICKTKMNDNRNKIIMTIGMNKTQAIS